MKVLGSILLFLISALGFYGSYVLITTPVEGPGYIRVFVQWILPFFAAIASVYIFDIAINLWFGWQEDVQLKEMLQEFDTKSDYQQIEIRCSNAKLFKNFCEQLNHCVLEPEYDSEKRILRAYKMKPR